MIRRPLDYMPCDKTFEIDDNGRQETCHATGYEVCFGDPDTLGNWWNEYERSNGEMLYGR